MLHVMMYKLSGSFMVSGGNMLGDKHNSIQWQLDKILGLNVVRPFSGAEGCMSPLVHNHAHF